MWHLIMATAFAGYGVPVDGHPTTEERELHLWVNAVRVDPEAFSSDYNGCSYDSFLDDEKVPKPPLMWSEPLSAAAAFHSADQADNSFMDHDSSDGTSFFDRVSRFYSGFTSGENVAYNYRSMWQVMFSGWMCSDGHRSNILHDGFTDYAGVVDFSAVNEPYYTQNFGAGAGLTAVPMRAGTHVAPPTGGASLYVDVTGGVVEAVEVVLNQETIPMQLAYGREGQGVYQYDLAELADCNAYYFQAIVDGEEARFPSEGAFGWGDCEFTDKATSYIGVESVSNPAPPTGFDADGNPMVELPGYGFISGPVVGCSQSQSPMTGALWGLGVLALFMPRRRR